MVLFFLLAGMAPTAPVTKQLPYTKTVSLGTGMPYTFRFSLWTAETGGTQVWSEDQSMVLASSVINAVLGKVTALSGVDFSQQLWVQVEQGGIVLGSRDLLTAAPYALWSAIGTDSTKVAKSGDTMTGTLNLQANGLTVGTNQLVVAGGNVGIGTTMAPTQKLEVNGTVKAAAFNGDGFYNNGARTFLLGKDGADNHWVMAGGTVEGRDNALGFNYKGKSIIAGPGWTITAGGLNNNSARTNLLGVDGASNHWVMAGGTVEGRDNALGFNYKSKSITAGPGWTITAGGLNNNGVRTYLLGMDGAVNHWVMAGGTVEGRDNALGFNYKGKNIFAGPGWTKNFLANHPLDPTHKYLSHATLEGPENAVFYRGEGRLEKGSAVIRLPDYFEALTRKEGRTVLLTPIFEGEEALSMLASSVVSGGAFSVKSIDAKNLSQRFYWEVKAVRADVDILETEFPKEQVDAGHTAGAPC